MKQASDSPRFMPLLPLAGFCCLAASFVASAETVHLNNGASVKGRVLSREPDRVIVDLGFTVLTVPSEIVLRIEEEQANGGKPDTAATDQLWLTAATRPEMTVRQNVLRCGEAVVQIRTSTGLGSGFVIHPAGYVVTNDHVIAGEQEVSITLYKRQGNDLINEHFRRVQIIATNPHVDLALLKIDDAPGREFQTVPLGESDDLRQGQTVFAIGSPLGLERSVSTGIISLKNRAMEGRLFIQTTTQINPGNSGGPLFNLRGEVVGVTNMKIVAAGAEGLGFAIPVSELKHFVANRDAFAFDPRHPNAGFRYHRPPQPPASLPLPPPASEVKPAEINKEGTKNTKKAKSSGKKG